MAKSYGGGSSPPRQVEIPDNTLLDIGRLVRACAEIEDLVTLYICHLAGTSESKALVILGRTTITRRVEMGLYLAKMTGTEITEIHKRIFGEAFKDIYFCRNAVCHGRYLGVDDTGGYAFLTNNTDDPIGEASISVVVSYDPLVIGNFAKMAEDAIPLIEKELKLEASRKERLQRPLLPHKKYQPRNKKSK